MRYNVDRLKGIVDKKGESKENGHINNIQKMT